MLNKNPEVPIPPKEAEEHTRHNAELQNHEGGGNVIPDAYNAPFSGVLLFLGACMFTLLVILFTLSFSYISLFDSFEFNSEFLQTSHWTVGMFTLLFVPFMLAVTSFYNKILAGLDTRPVLTSFKFIFLGILLFAIVDLVFIVFLIQCEDMCGVELVVAPVLYSPVLFIALLVIARIIKKKTFLLTPLATRIKSVIKKATSIIFIIGAILALVIFFDYTTHGEVLRISQINESTFVAQNSLVTDDISQCDEFPDDRNEFDSTGRCYSVFFTETLKNKGVDSFIASKAKCLEVTFPDACLRSYDDVFTWSDFSSAERENYVVESAPGLVYTSFLPVWIILYEAVAKPDMAYVVDFREKAEALVSRLQNHDLFKNTSFTVELTDDSELYYLSPEYDPESGRNIEEFEHYFKSSSLEFKADKEDYISHRTEFLELYNEEIYPALYSDISDDSKAFFYTHEEIHYGYESPYEEPYPEELNVEEVTNDFSEKYWSYIEAGNPAYCDSSVSEGAPDGYIGDYIEDAIFPCYEFFFDVILIEGGEDTLIQFEDACQNVKYEEICQKAYKKLR